MTLYNQGNESMLAYQRVHIPVKEWRRLTRGQCTIEARCDIHGYHRIGAQDVLSDFIEDCQSNSFTTVLIIHGKGGVLKDLTDEYLRYHSGVLAFVSAAPKHGGTGAVYVRLKKSAVDEPHEP